MEPGELLTYSGKDQKLDKKQVISSKLHTSWKDGFLIFNNATLQEILLKMEEIYGVKTLVENESNNDRTFNTMLPLEELDTALQILEKTIQLSIDRKDKTLLIK